MKRLLILLLALFVGIGSAAPVLAAGEKRMSGEITRIDSSANTMKVTGKMGVKQFSIGDNARFIGCTGPNELMPGMKVVVYYISKDGVPAAIKIKKVNMGTPNGIIPGQNDNNAAATAATKPLEDTGK